MYSNQRFRTIFGILLVLATGLLSAQQNWEGSAIVGRYGEFPPGGLYAASNAFPVNSVIEVTNPSTGRTQRLIVAQRAENPGVLLVVSQAAAEELGVSRGATFQVQVEPVEMPPLTSVAPNEDLPFHPDPDINPRAALGNPNAELLEPNGAERDGAVTSAQVPEGEAEPEETPSVAQAPEESEAPAEEPPASSVAEGSTEAPTEAPSDVGEDEPAAPSEEAPRVVEKPEEKPADKPGESVEAREATPEPSTAAESTPEPPADDGVPEPTEPEAPARPMPSLPTLVMRPEPYLEPTTPIAEPELPDDAEPVEAESVAPAEEAPEIAEAPETAGPGEKELFPPAPEQELYAALARPPRPEEPAIVAELPVAPASEALEVESDTLGPRFPNPVELTVSLPEAPGVETPEISDLTPKRPGEEGLEGTIALAMPESGELTEGPEATEDLVERPDGPVTEIPLRVVGEIVPPQPEEERLTRPSGAPREEVVSLEPAEFRPPDPPQPEDEESISPGDRPEGEERGEIALSESPEPPTEGSPVEEEPSVAAREESSVEGEPDEEPESEEPMSEGDEPSEAAPVREPVQTPARAARGDAGEMAITSALPRDGYYLQVGAFSDPSGARSAVERLGGDFPVKVVSSGTNMLRVFVGPLEEDERGAVLYLVRARGYRDAFLRNNDG